MFATQHRKVRTLIVTVALALVGIRRGPVSYGRQHLTVSERMLRHGSVELRPVPGLGVHNIVVLLPLPLYHDVPVGWRLP